MCISERGINFSYHKETAGVRLLNPAEVVSILTTATASEKNNQFDGKRERNWEMEREGKENNRKLHESSSLFSSDFNSHLIQSPLLCHLSAFD